jgi:hypothetical protein
MTGRHRSPTTESVASPNGRVHADLHLACRELFERAAIGTVQFGCPDINGLFRGGCKTVLP